MLLKRYKDINYVLDLDYEEGMDLIIHALKEKNEELLLTRWMIGYQDSLTFEEFKRDLGVYQVQDDRSEEEILDMVKGILS